MRFKKGGKMNKEKLAVIVLDTYKLLEHVHSCVTSNVTLDENEHVKLRDDLQALLNKTSELYYE